MFMTKYFHFYYFLWWPTISFPIYLFSFSLQVYFLLLNKTWSLVSVFKCHFLFSLEKLYIAFIIVDEKIFHVEICLPVSWRIGGKTIEADSFLNDYRLPPPQLVVESFNLHSIEYVEEDTCNHLLTIPYNDKKLFRYDMNY